MISSSNPPSIFSPNVGALNFSHTPFSITSSPTRITPPIHHEASSNCFPSMQASKENIPLSQLVSLQQRSVHNLDTSLAPTWAEESGLFSSGKSFQRSSSGPSFRLHCDCSSVPAPTLSSSSTSSPYFSTQSMSPIRSKSLSPPLCSLDNVQSTNDIHPHHHHHRPYSSCDNSSNPLSTVIEPYPLKPTTIVLQSTDEVNTCNKTISQPTFNTSVIGSSVNMSPARNLVMPRDVEVIKSTGSSGSPVTSSPEFKLPSYHRSKLRRLGQAALETSGKPGGGSIVGRVKKGGVFKPGSTSTMASGFAHSSSLHPPSFSSKKSHHDQMATQSSAWQLQQLSYHPDFFNEEVLLSANRFRLPGTDDDNDGYDNSDDDVTTLDPTSLSRLADRKCISLHGLGSRANHQCSSPPDGRRPVQSNAVNCSSQAPSFTSNPLFTQPIHPLPQSSPPTSHDKKPAVFHPNPSILSISPSKLQHPVLALFSSAPNTSSPSQPEIHPLGKKQRQQTYLPPSSIVNHNYARGPSDLPPPEPLPLPPLPPPPPPTIQHQPSMPTPTISTNRDHKDQDQSSLFLKYKEATQATLRVGLGANLDQTHPNSQSKTCGSNVKHSGKKSPKTHRRQKSFPLELCNKPLAIAETEQLQNSQQHPQRSSVDSACGKSQQSSNKAPVPPHGKMKKSGSMSAVPWTKGQGQSQQGVKGRDGVTVDRRKSTKC